MFHATKIPLPAFDPLQFSQALLAHFDDHARPMPWRLHITPYRVWISEIMLQQTTVATVTPYYARFLERFPSLESLATAPLDDVLHQWQGLGYYSRARNLHACARTLWQEYGGRFPETVEELSKLKGIGPYTAAALSAIAFNKVATVVDGNVERVVSRVFRLEAPLPAVKKDIRALAETLTSPTRPRDYAGAIMDLGATVCTPTSPKCGLCPVRSFCAMSSPIEAQGYPRKAAKKERPYKAGTAFCLFDNQRRIYLRRRPSKGLLAHLWEVPSVGWEATAASVPSFVAAAFGESEGLSGTVQHAPIQASSADYKATSATGRLPFTLSSAPVVRHVFTHFTLDLTVQTAQVPVDGGSVSARTENKQAELGEDGWFALTALPPLPTLMRKVLERAVS